MPGFNVDNVADLLERFHPGADSLAEALRSQYPPDSRDVGYQALEYHRQVSSPDGVSPERLRALIGAIDLTSLKGFDTAEGIRALCAQALRPDEIIETPSCAAVCVYPAFITTAREVLHDTRVRVATVAAGFPDGQTLTEIKIAEVRACVRAGADEVDVVLNRGAFAEGRLSAVYAELIALREAAEGVVLKVILETCELSDDEAIQRAATIAMLAGAEFVKTSTGKGAGGATLPHIIIIADAVSEFAVRTGRFVGIKPADGVSLELALASAAVIEKKLGSDALCPERFRIGASSLLAQLLSRLAQSEVAL